MLELAVNLFWGAATQIVENIQAKVWAASAVLDAYLARAAQAHQATNCLTEGMFPSWLFCLCVEVNFSTLEQYSLKTPRRPRASWMPNLRRRGY